MLDFRINTFDNQLHEGLSSNYRCKFVKPSANSHYPLHLSVELKSLTLNDFPLDPITYKHEQSYVERIALINDLYSIVHDALYDCDVRVYTSMDKLIITDDDNSKLLIFIYNYEKGFNYKNYNYDFRQTGPMYFDTAMVDEIRKLIQSQISFVLERPITSELVEVIGLSSDVVMTKFYNTHPSNLPIKDVRLPCLRCRDLGHYSFNC